MRTRILRPATTAANPLQSLIARKWRPQWICQSCRHQSPPPPMTSFRRTLTTSTIKTSSTSSATQARPSDPSPAKPYYITTPIFYVNAAPHVGHMYTMILADVLKRWQTLRGRRAILCTGTDEHGLKIQQAAAKAGLEPREFCHRGAQVFKDLGEQIHVSADIFMRTTDERHKEAVEYAWQMLAEKGYIYERQHEGWYSVSDETFYPASQVQLIVDPPTGKKIMVSVETGKEVEWTSERNYHFRLSIFRDELLEFYAKNSDFIVPKHRMEEVVREVTAGLDDLSVSRPVERLTWGVRVPTDPSQTIYVWIDALLNYATAAGYPFSPGKEAAGGWPADVHVVGKDIVRFHCIYWPALLMALGLPLPKQILTHAHWTLGRQKMAKSTGNVVNPFFALERFGVDVMRWYLVSSGGIVDDSDYDNRYIIEKHRKHLQGGLGNLVSRIMRHKGWSVPRAIKRFAHSSPDQPATVTDDAAREIAQWHGAIRRAPAEVEAHMKDLMPNKALQAITVLIAQNNGYLQKFEPWKLVTKMKALEEKRSKADSSASNTLENVEDAESVAGIDNLQRKSRDQQIADLEAEVDRTVYLSAESLRLAGIMLQPFMPTSAAKLLDLMGVRQDRRSWEWCQIGRDDEYGMSTVDMSNRAEGLLFPGLTGCS